MAFALSITALALAAHPALAALAAPQECDEDLCHMSHLQLQVSGIPNATNWAALGGVCLAELPEEYQTRPVSYVLQKHEWKEKDGWCVFGAVDPWISGCAACRKLRDMQRICGGPDFEERNAQNAPLSRWLAADPS